ncbi:hypothetical protein [Baaleninema sp.]|uniref:hypothetical protein n=1 Tax=Baaleninema sp. TaxID=3101197 RepID=UPI003CFF3C0F
MVRAEIFTQAKQGNPEAIATLMNQSLQAKQITVNVRIDGTHLSAIATGEQPPDREFMLNFVRRGLEKLNAVAIDRVTVLAFVRESTVPLWRETIDITAPTYPEAHSNAIASPRRESFANGHRNGNSNRPSSVSLLASPVPRQLAQKRARRQQQARTAFDRLKLIVGILLFLIVSALSVILAAIVKLFTTLLAENSLYRIQFLGDLMRGIEMAEIFNILVFAILGLGLGVATVFVPRQFGIRFNAAVVILLLPVLLSVGPIVRYDNWIQEFSTNENITEIESKAHTDTYLNQRVSQTGIFGFYLHTARYPSLPVRIAQLDSLDLLESSAVSRVESKVGLTSERLSLSFAVCMWGIRIFYFLVSAITVIAHFGQGVDLADRISDRPA